MVKIKKRINKTRIIITITNASIVTWMIYSGIPFLKALVIVGIVMYVNFFDGFQYGKKLNSKP